MSLSSFNNDPARIEKRLQIGTNGGRYALSTPGPGNRLPFIADPHIRLQYWGANYMQNGVGIEDDLRGMTRRIVGHDATEYNKTPVGGQSALSIWPIEKGVVVDESRSILPAFLFREIDFSRWEEPIHDPQYKAEEKLKDGLQSRILVKDTWRYGGVHPI
jgi:hypothetical protein